MLRRQHSNPATARPGARSVQFSARPSAQHWRGLQSACWTAFAALALTACGGGDSPLNDAGAQTPPPVEVARLHFILRPDMAGRWYVQADVDHASSGVLPTVGYDAARNQLTVAFDRRYTHAGVILVAPDDDFTKRGVRMGCGLGIASATCTVTVRDVEIDPREILNYVPAGAGNFFVSAVMVNRP